MPCRYGDVTLQNKRAYAERHGYDLHVFDNSIAGECVHVSGGWRLDWQELIGTGMLAQSLGTNYWAA